MKKKVIFLFIFVLSAGMGMANGQSTLYLKNIEVTGTEQIETTDVIISQVPHGLSGYNLTVSISNPSIAEIVEVEFPSWATLHTNSSLPSSTVWIKAVDLNKKIEENAANVTLATIKLKSKKEGTTPINISITKIDDDNGYPIDVIAKNATLQVIVNYPPSKPDLQIPSSGYVGHSISISAKANDPDGDKIRYGFDWNNDGIVDEWTGYYDSDITASISHTWSNEGTYSIKVIAEDEHGMEGEWSNVKNIVISKYVPPSPPPNQPPSITITSPSNNATVNGTITIQGTANDDKSVAKVEVRIDNGVWTQAVGTTSWSYNIDTTLLNNGQHEIEARSYDGSLYSSIASISINVFNNHKPNVAITSPQNGSIVKGNIVIKGKAWDDDGNDTVTKVEIRIDNGTWNVANGTTSWNYSMDTKALENGMHIVEARSYDGHDYSNIASIHIEVKNEKKTLGFEMIAFAIAILIAILIRKSK